MFKSYRFRIYPNDNQKKLIHKTFGCYRFIYNYFLNQCKLNGYKKAFDMIKELPSLEKEYLWLREVDSCSLRCAIFNLEDAYRNFFSKRGNYPTFKSKGKRQTYRTNCIRSTYKGREYQSIELNLKNKTIKLPKLKEIAIRGYRNLEEMNGKIINATVIYETTGKYYVSVLVEEVNVKEEKVKPKSIVGIDLGLKDLVITSSGEKYNNPKSLKKYEKRLKRYQRSLSRKRRESKNYQKMKRKLSILHNKIKNARKYSIINIVNNIVKEYDIIISEKLKVKEMSKNRHLSKSIHDASFHRICSMIQEKCEEKGKYYYQVDTYYPSSKTCSVCGTKTKQTESLEVREWECEVCRTHHDRDINASINILFEGLKYCFSK